MIKAIIFDFYGVLCSEKFWHQLKADPKVASDFKRMAEELHLGDLSWRDFIDKIAAQTNRRAEDIATAYAAEHINVPLVDYINKLRPKYKTGLLSNAAYEAFEPRGREIGFDKLFDCTVVSSQIGVTKPDPRIYRHILQKLDVESAESVYIDDSPRLAEAARQLGMKAIHYRDFEQMKAELEALLAGSDN